MLIIKHFRMILRYFRGKDNKSMNEKRAEAWHAIKGKQHLYKTAYIRATLDPVGILGVREPGVFLCVHVDGSEKDYGCEELFQFCL